MYRGLPTTNLDEVGLPFTSNQCVQHALNFGQRTPTLTSGRRIGKTHGTGEIAFIVHFDQCQTAVLLVIRTEAAVERTTVKRVTLKAQRNISGFKKALAVFEIGSVVRDESFLHTVQSTSL